MIYNALRWAVLIETATVLLAYLWAGVQLLRSPWPKDRIVRRMMIGRLCRVWSVAGVFALATLAIINRFDKAVVSWQLIPWQLIMFGFAGAWILLDRAHYYPPRIDEKAPAAARAIVALTEREDE